MRFHVKRLDQSGFDHVTLAVIFIVLFALIGTFLLVESRAATSYEQLRVGISNTCLAGGTVEGCSNTNANEAWSLPHVANFQIENQNGQCLDDWNAGVGTSSKPYVYLRTYTCYSGDTHQEWNWHDDHLVNTGSGGCISAIGGGAAGSQLMVYSCVYSGTNGKIVPSDQDWTEATITAATTSEQQTLCKQFGYGSSGSSCNNIGTAISYIGNKGNGYSSWSNNTQLECLGELWNRESGWNNLIINSSSDAFGIAQALGHGNPNGSTRAKVTADLVGGGTETLYVNEYPTYNANAGQAQAQIQWGLSYIEGQYGSPCAAWSHEINYGWYVPVVPK